MLDFVGFGRYISAIDGGPSTHHQLRLREMQNKKKRKKYTKFIILSLVLTYI